MGIKGFRGEGGEMKRGLRDQGIKELRRRQMNQRQGR